ncbi:Neutral ceramidase [Borealophlyctis nickersoniae]|nr:Neutral ceramidase [Borealophlyctis nickersoniae]
MALFRALYASVVLLFAVLVLYQDYAFVHASPVPIQPLAKRQGNGGLMVGLGMSDVTGPIGEITMTGYAELGQKANGIHLRLKARAFIFASASNPSRRVVFVSSDMGSPSHRTRKLAVQYLQSKLSGADAALYSIDNIMVSATHTHSGPGGYSDDFLYQIPNFGATPGARESIAQGIADAIYAAHQDFSSGTVTITRGRLDNASINRSAGSYLNNPASERARYPDDVDRDMVLVSVKSGDRLRGVVNWFAVHPVSMNASNSLVSGDNKGYASYLWELEQRGSGNSKFIAAFAQTNAGDVSPNLEGPHCKDTGAPCDGGKDSCGGNISLCIARGPGYEEGGDQRSTEIIGQRQFQKGKELVESPPPAPTTKVVDASSANVVVDYRHTWIEMSEIAVTNATTGASVKLCHPAMGYAFSAGTTDNPATGISFQGDNDPNGANKPFWNFVRNILKTPSQELVECHKPKVVLLSTGEMSVPYWWQPQKLPVQLFLIGRKLAIIGFPAEITTMSGRRLREAVLAQLVDDNTVDADAEVVIAGLSNLYSSYVTTFEEYQVQRYEGGSTSYGPNTLNGHIQTFKTLAHSFKTGSLPPPSPAFPSTPEPTDNKDVNFLTGVVLDTAPAGKSFGDVTVQPGQGPFGKGSTVKAEFVCAHPRNGASTQSTLGNVELLGGVLPGGASSTYMTVEQQLPDGRWRVVLDDAGWDTKYRWARVGVAESRCTVEWNIRATTSVPAGTYRFRYFGR